MARDRLPYYALYGNVRILKAYCDQCERYAFVIKGQLQCCDARMTAPASGYKRESEPEHKRGLPSRQFRDMQLARQDHRCFYCEQSFGSRIVRTLINRDGTTRSKSVELAVHWDHVVPFDYAQNNADSNFVAACHVCNGIKHDKCFATTTEARIYVEIRRQEKGYPTNFLIQTAAKETKKPASAPESPATGILQDPGDPNWDGKGWQLDLFDR